MICVATTSNEKEMSDGGRGRASLGVEVWKSSEKWRTQRSAVRSIAWLGLLSKDIVYRNPNLSSGTGLEPPANKSSECGVIKNRMTSALLHLCGDNISGLSIHLKNRDTAAS